MPDPFDALLNTTCSILEHGPASDGYGIERPLATVLTGVPCRVSFKSGSEKKTPDEMGKNDARIFMRPQPVTHRSWIKTADGSLYNVLVVNNPGGMNHHYELECEVIFS